MKKQYIQPTAFVHVLIMESKLLAGTDIEGTGQTTNNVTDLVDPTLKPTVENAGEEEDEIPN